LYLFINKTWVISEADNVVVHSLYITVQPEGYHSFTDTDTLLEIQATNVHEYVTIE